jgi:eukaryotic-like serine/threonine-protein kinase
MPRAPGSREGTRLAAYQLGKLLGSGGMGDVYRATGEGRGRGVALKILAGELARDPKAVARFAREAEAVMRLDHPNVIRIHEVGSWRGQHFIAMELCGGPSFRRMIHEHEQPARIVGVLAQIAEGLAHAHARGIVHRDIKPENVLLTRSGQARVVDFGLARVSDVSSLTTDGSLFGTAKYMSPEQAQGQRAGPPSDVYSFGVMLYEAISGALPFDSETQHGFIFKHVAEAPRRPELHAGFPAALGRLALDCLDKDPGARPTMDEVGERLRATRRGRARRRRWLVVAVGIALLAAWLAFPHALDALSEGWFGAPVARALRDAALAVRGLVP